MSEILEEETQTTLLNLNAKEYNAYWVDPKQPLLIPDQPLHWKAHELQILLQILQKQAARQPGQFNSRNYIDTLNEYTNCVTAIKKGKNELDEGKVVIDRHDETTPEMGDGNAAGLGVRISTDNPLAR